MVERPTGVASALRAEGALRAQADQLTFVSRFRPLLLPGSQYVGPLAGGSSVEVASFPISTHE